MTDIPRRIPPTPGRRLKTRLNATPGLAEGLSRTLGPVQPRAGGAGRSQQPAGDYDRVAVGYRIDDPTLLAGSPAPFATWTFTEEDTDPNNAMSAVDGAVYIFEAGRYATNLWLKVAGIEAADPACSIRFFCDVAGPFATGFDCGVRGGDAQGGRSILASTSRTYYDPGDGLDGGLFFGIAYANLDTVNVTQILAEVHVQRLA